MLAAPPGGGAASPAGHGCAGGAEIVVVRDPLSEQDLRAVIAEFERRLVEVGAHAYNYPAPELLLPLGAEDRLTLLWTGASEFADAESTHDLFATSPLFPRDEGGLSWSLSRFDPEPRPERVADAVCAAGRLATAGGGTGAVVLITHPDTPDGSLLTPVEARSCLAALGVPLSVWTTVESPEALPERWGEVLGVVTWDQLGEAIDGLHRALAAGCRDGADPPGPDGLARDAAEAGEARR